MDSLADAYFKENLKLV